MSRSIPWWVPAMGGDELGLVEKVLASNYINEGDVTETFEREIAKIVGTKFAVATTSGTVAITLGLLAAGIGHGDEVIVPDVTFIATANAVNLAGATPILCDVDESLGISPAAIRARLTSRTKAIVPVHVSGRSCDMKGVLAIAKEHGLRVIEDAAEALGSKRDGSMLGAIGDGGCFSFSPNKTITTGQGGMLVTNDAALYARARELKDQGRPVRGTGGDDTHHSIGFNFKLTNLQAAVGLGQLGLFRGRAERQRAIYRQYAEKLAGLPGFRLYGFDLDGGEIPQWTDADVERRDELDAALRESNMHCRRFWHAIHTQAPYRASDERFPNASRLARRSIWLPSAFQLTDEDVAAVCTRIRTFYGARA